VIQGNTETHCGKWIHDTYIISILYILNRKNSKEGRKVLMPKTPKYDDPFCKRSLP